MASELSNSFQPNSASYESNLDALSLDLLRRRGSIPFRLVRHTPNTDTTPSHDPFIPSEKAQNEPDSSIWEPISFTDLTLVKEKSLNQVSRKKPSPAGFGPGTRNWARNKP